MVNKLGLQTESSVQTEVVSNWKVLRVIGTTMRVIKKTPTTGIYRTYGKKTEVKTQDILKAMGGVEDSDRNTLRVCVNEWQNRDSY